MKRLFIILTWIAAVALPAAITSACIVDCCALQAAMPHCNGMAKIVAEKPLHDATPQQKSAPSLKRSPIAIATSVIDVPTRAISFSFNPTRAERDVGLHLLLVTLLI
ncbi:MAG TPA: hypothetical protein VJ032_15020 [Thermoanaerobaculia bacterium]|nr:hypothetical protein [Thermoanaerobaculia bacterium]